MTEPTIIKASATYHALTAYGVEIPKALASPKAAIAWAEEDGDRYGCVRIVRRIGTAVRTIWKPEAQRVAA